MSIGGKLCRILISLMFFIYMTRREKEMEARKGNEVLIGNYQDLKAEIDKREYAMLRQLACN